MPRVEAAGGTIAAVAVTAPFSQMAFADHLSVTQNQISRLEQIFELLGEKVEAKKCEGLEGLLREGESVINDTETGSATRDVGLIVSAQGRDFPHA